MANIKLKNAQGQTVTYNEVAVIKVKDTDDNDVNFTISLGQQTTFMKDTNDLYQMQNQNTGVATSIPTEPTKVGYWFKGWSNVSHEYIPANKVSLPQVFNTDTTLYGMWLETPSATASVTGLGSQYTSGVTFNVSADFPTTFSEETDTFGNVFVKIPTIYRKIITTTDNQIVDMQLSTTKIDDDYKPYPCFVKEDGTTVMPYILIGKYCMSSSSQANSVNATPVSMTIGAGRTLARALGNGYQLYDWQMRQLFNDLVIVARRSVNVNANPLIGIDHLASDIWVDGYAHNNTDWIFSYKPSKYVDNPTSSTDGYNLASYSCPSASGQEIKKLGYDSNHPFFNNVSEVISDSAYNSYYYDAWYYSGGNHPVYSYVSFGDAFVGLFYSVSANGWSHAIRVRLCYRPI